jgi:protein-S-isoprenylcysteine O-methyltransferase Ste14
MATPVNERRGEGVHIGLLIRGAIFTALAPAVVGGWLPVAIADADPAGGLWQAGWVFVVVGAAIYLACLRRFLAAGGTPSIYFTRPIRFLIGEEPDALVTRGLYGRTRNPMYLGVLIATAGWAIVFASTRVAIYWLVVFGLFNAVVILVEEPHLRAERGDEYDLYCRRVRRWL